MISKNETHSCRAISPFDIGCLISFCLGIYLLCHRFFLLRISTLSLSSSLEHVILSGHVDCPSELVPLRFVEDLFNRDVVLFAPCDGNTGIEIV